MQQMQVIGFAILGFGVVLGASGGPALFGPEFALVPIAVGAVGLMVCVLGARDPAA
jgi:hypothetical protein